jgi:1,4-alpha-glucan branching enzyme
MAFFGPYFSRKGACLMKLLQTTENRVRFELTAKPGSQVFVAGTFNRWNPTANPLSDKQNRGHFHAALHIPAGRHEYKFVVDGVWTMDPKCTASAPNDCGTMNNVL